MELAAVVVVADREQVRAKLVVAPLEKAVEGLPLRTAQLEVKLEVPVLIRGGVRVEENGSPKVTVSEITPLEEARPKLPRALRIRVPLETATDATVDALYSICVERKGEAKVLFDVERPGDFMVVMEAEGYNVQPDRAFISRVEELCGRGSVRIVD